jgi:4-amino-4-deoxy-L-arabinose transferase-like glycosyltransferase
MQFGHSILWLSFGAVVLSTVLIYQMYRLALRLTSQASIAGLAAGFVAVNPTFVFYSPTLYCENLFAVLMFMALLLALGPGAAKESCLPWWQWALSGACFGAAMLTRGDARLYLPVFAALCLVLHKWGRRAIVNGLVWILALGLVVFPWVVRNRLVYGEWIGTSSFAGHIFYLGHNPGPREAGHGLDGTTDLESSKKGYQLGLQYIRESSLRVLIKDVVRATREHYLRSGNYAFAASTMVPKYSLLGIAEFPPRWPITMTPGRYTALNQVMWLHRLTYFYFVLLLGTLISVCFSQRYSLSMWLSLYGMIALNGVGFCVVIGYGDARFRYLAEVLFCVLTAMAVVEMAGRLERWRESRDHGKRGQPTDDQEEPILVTKKSSASWA